MKADADGCGEEGEGTGRGRVSLQVIGKMQKEH